jgi:hypothetical protein
MEDDQLPEEKFLGTRPTLNSVLIQPRMCFQCKNRKAREAFSPLQWDLGSHFLAFSPHNIPLGRCLECYPKQKEESNQRKGYEAEEQRQLRYEAVDSISYD